MITLKHFQMVIASILVILVQKVVLSTEIVSKIFVNVIKDFKVLIALSHKNVSLNVIWVEYVMMIYNATVIQDTVVNFAKTS